MKAIYLTQFGESKNCFEIRETDIPKAGKGEVVIKVLASGLNFADIMARRGLYNDTPALPAVLGYDVSGTIAELGEGVDGFEPGNKVLIQVNGTLSNWGWDSVFTVRSDW
ncbi:MAG: alcohol dehydrogenase catalytic domain-containing protein [Bacteroidales bacterium]|nr:alcohol dehydrogenase catalytic domain-containing protein [Bacteroidales bacterium]